MAHERLAVLAWQQRKDLAILRLTLLQTTTDTAWRIVPWHGQELHVWMVYKYGGIIFPVPHD